MHTIGTTDLVPIVLNAARRLLCGSLSRRPAFNRRERRLYERLCADKTIAYRRIEQERIPMRDAVDELRKLGIPVESIENQDLPI